MSAEAGTLAILTVNIGNPSPERAERQLEWLDERPEQVLVLTETAPSRGCELIAGRLDGAGWQVQLPIPAEGERGVLIASRVASSRGGTGVVEYLPSRAERVVLEGCGLGVLGIYVPSRDASVAKTERKQRFLAGLAAAVAPAPARGVLIGDLNVLEPAHQPRYAWFAEWEYDFYRGLADCGWVDAYRLLSPTEIEHSWESHDGDGFRYDHAFVSAALADLVIDCSYVHETRSLGLTDHSALSLTLKLEGTRPLDVQGSLKGEPTTLF